MQKAFLIVSDPGKEGDDSIRDWVITLCQSRVASVSSSHLSIATGHDLKSFFSRTCIHFPSSSVPVIPKKDFEKGPLNPLLPSDKNSVRSSRPSAFFLSLLLFLPPTS